MQTIIFGLVVFGTAVFLAFLEPITRRCRRLVQKYEERKRPISAEPKDTIDHVESPPLPQITPEETAGFHFRRLLNKGGILGTLFVPLLLVFLPLNAKILSEAFEVVLDRAGYVLIEISLFKISLEITDLHIYGLALGIAQLLLGAAYAASCEAKSANRWLVLLGGVLPALIFEVFVSGWRGHLLASAEGGHLAQQPLLLTIANGLQAYVCAFTEVLSGYWGIHLFFIPFIQTLAWGIVSPFRMFRGWVISLVRGLRMGKQKRHSDPDAPGVLVRAGAYLDEAMFDPLRSIEGFLACLMRRFRPAQEVSHA